MIHFDNDWQDILQAEFAKPYYVALRNFLKKEYSTYNIYPDMHDIYNAFRYTCYSKVKAVILGQDPYHNKNQAHGLAFSVKEGIKSPPSLVNIFKELEADLGITAPNHGDLTSWANEGVFLLNTALTVREHQANSHRNKGWECLTDSVITALSNRKTPMVFMLWGNNAQSKIPLIDTSKHLILKAPHPSPLSAFGGFFGCKHFSKTNDFLISKDISPINWKV